MIKNPLSSLNLSHHLHIDDFCDQLELNFHTRYFIYACANYSYMKHQGVSKEQLDDAKRVVELSSQSSLIFKRGSFFNRLRRAIGVLFLINVEKSIFREINQIRILFEDLPFLDTPMHNIILLMILFVKTEDFYYRELLTPALQYI